MTIEEYMEEEYEKGKAEGLAEGKAITLVSLVKAGLLTYDQAVSQAEDPDSFKKMLEGSID